jgi:alanyl-tRNA synthetase
MAWQVSKNEEDLWIATAGCLADWYMPSFINKFIEKYPSFLSKKKDLSKTVFHSPVGKLVKLLFFLQKGPTSEVRKSVRILTRIKSPNEIFKQTTPAGKFLYKRFKSINLMYEELLTEAKKGVTRSKVLVFYYTEKKWSFTANLANELMARYQKKMVIITRNKSGEMKCSLRGKNVVVYLKKALEGVEGRGGGHPDACGAVIKEEDWDKFLTQFKEALKK